jgi:hypothetical protein
MLYAPHTKRMPAHPESANFVTFILSSRCWDDICADVESSKVRPRLLPPCEICPPGVKSLGKHILVLHIYRFTLTTEIFISKGMSHELELRHKGAIIRVLVMI